MLLRVAQGSNRSASLKQEPSQTWFFLRSLQQAYQLGASIRRESNLSVCPKGRPSSGVKPLHTVSNWSKLISRGRKSTCCTCIFFAHCQYLEHISLPSHLKEISAEAFEACSSLCTLALPQQLCYIGHRAFAGCSKLECLTYRCKKTTRRRLRIADNAFEACNALTTPGGILYLLLISNKGNTSRCRRNKTQQ